ncbi:hypothetical protein KKC60_02480 [Patescibacteria group bacterium]|nr:hypothetical protein [Patescibacteria group bacterium]
MDRLATNREFVYVLKKACWVLGQKVPSQAIAIVPIGDDIYAVKLIGEYLEDPDKFTWVSDTRALSKNDIPAAIHRLLGKNAGNVLAFYREMVLFHPMTFQWIHVSSTKMERILFNGESIVSNNFTLL